jgi:hypothetical protein
MNKRFWLSVVVVVVLLVVLGYVVHGVMLFGDYHAGPMARLYRSDAEQMSYLPFLFPAHILAAIGIVWLYQRGRPTESWVMDGLKFGVAIAVLMIVHKFVAYYTVQPIPGMVTVKQILFDSIAMIAIGVAVARLNR